jgi:D-methionine transport system permease protein
VAGAIPPLVVGCTPFSCAVGETALREVDRGLVEATQSMGATTWQIIWHTLLPESRPGLTPSRDRNRTGGLHRDGRSDRRRGLGDLAIRFGYQRFQTDVMVVTVALLVLLVQGLQMTGDRLVSHCSRR